MIDFFEDVAEYCRLAVPREERLPIAIVGAGAIGGFVGARLVAAGDDRVRRQTACAQDGGIDLGPQ